MNYFFRKVNEKMDSGVNCLWGFLCKFWFMVMIYYLVFYFSGMLDVKEIFRYWWLFRMVCKNVVCLKVSWLIGLINVEYLLVYWGWSFFVEVFMKVFYGIFLFICIINCVGIGVEVVYDVVFIL